MKTNIALAAALALGAAAEIMAEVAQELVPNRRVIALDDLRFRRPLAFADGRLKLFARAERSASSDPSVAVVKVLHRDERQDSAWTWPAMEATVLLAAERPLTEPVDVPYPIFERNEALWLKTVSQIVLHGAERRPFAEMPGHP